MFASKYEMFTMDMKPDNELIFDQELFLGKLSENKIERIDAMLLENTSKTWRKVARVVGMFMGSQASEFRGIPDIYLASRVDVLVESGALEFQGMLGYMRYCEVRKASLDRYRVSENIAQ